ncbi:DUF1801 domain-containing protein [Candidatus Gracilibacteria bacterium]|nr:DUF1801 domain-containing protein [Candidatus Gracilibacteria bacterium]
MSDAKTQPTGQDVEVFLDAIADERQRADSRALVALMHTVTGEEPKMWGPSIIGFGDYQYRYASGREGDWFLTGFSPRKQNITLYLVYGFERHEGLMQQLGKHKIGKACLYIKRLSDVHVDVLRELIERSVAEVKASNAVGGVTAS